MPPPSSTAPFTTPTASTSPATASDADAPPDRAQRIDDQPATLPKIYCQQGARQPGDIISERRATSSRNQRATSSESAPCARSCSAGRGCCHLATQSARIAGPPPTTGNPAEIRRANYQDLVSLPSLWREAGNDLV